MFGRDSAVGWRMENGDEDGDLDVLGGVRSGMVDWVAGGEERRGWN